MASFVSALGLAVLVALATSSARCATAKPKPPVESGQQADVHAEQNDHGEVCKVAFLRNGYNLQFSRQEVEGDTARLWLCDNAGTDFVEIKSDQIERIEQPPPVGPAEDTIPTPTAAAAAPAKDGLKGLISDVAARHQIDPDFVASVVKAESGFNPSAVSPKGARGLMQLMPQTAAELGVNNILDPVANLEGGTRYLRQLFDRYNGDTVKTLAAYNAGPARVDQYGGIPPIRETYDYVSRIIEDYNRKKLKQQAESAKAASLAER